MACFCYYKTIHLRGLDQMPEDKPLLLLPNHQNGLMDALLIAAYGNRAPYFLTRSDVFTNPLLKSLFNLLKMLPIYRIRDGRSSLGKNQGIFDTCARLLFRKEVILIFPEASHNIERRVRPLSKGFTRILFNAMEKYPGMDIRLVPVGINYADAAGFPDSAAFYFGKNMKFSSLFPSEDLRTASIQIREKVAAQIRLLTTHIKNEDQYESIIKRLDALKVNYLEPTKVNSLANDTSFESLKVNDPSGRPWYAIFLDLVFNILNFPILLIWKGIVKKRVPEIEFMSTYRFLFSIIFFPVFYALLFIVVGNSYNFGTSGVLVAGLFLFNLMYVKLR
jgi:1-acyl-sn-glycerol-3-phosphate acyltransferase